MSKHSDEESARILAEAHKLLATPPPPYTPPSSEPPTRRRRYYDPVNTGEPEPPERWRKLDTLPPNIATETWVSAKIDAALLRQREELIGEMLKATVVVVGDAVGNLLADSIEHERARFEADLRRLNLECVKLSSVLDSLHDLVALERSRTITLPALPLRRDVN
jgi:hypothetical protein